jgi:hypothetical protein
VSRTATEASGQGQYILGQVRGQRGCDHHSYFIGSGLPPSSTVRLQRVTEPALGMLLTTNENGYVFAYADTVTATLCQPRYGYGFQVVDPQTAACSVPSSSPSRCWQAQSIAVTVRSMPPNAQVTITAWGTDVLAHNGFEVTSRLFTDATGFARTEPFRPPWQCNTPALALSATAGEVSSHHTLLGELLYRIALPPGAPLLGFQPPGMPPRWVVT